MNILRARGHRGHQNHPLCFYKTVSARPRAFSVSSGSAWWLRAWALKPDRPGLETQPTIASWVTLA